MEQEFEGYFRNQSSKDPECRDRDAEYYTDDEIESMWIHSRDCDSGELDFNHE